MAKRFFEFPKNFVWGTATAAYQIEGAVKADGRGESIWDVFCRKPGMIEEGASGEDACRHYELWQKDIAMMKELGLKGYRMSIAWPRIFPQGRGQLNLKGLDFYERLIDELLRAGITPNITLYHWDLPQALEDQGGWTNRDTAYAFADYAGAVLKRLGNKGALWATFNEPWCVATFGYKTGIHAPGRTESDKVYNQVIHHILLAHGLGLKAMRQAANQPIQAGIVIVPSAPWPTPGSAEDIAAADAVWKLENDWWMYPLLLGRYPEDVWQWKGADVPEVRPGDMEIISEPMDFLGLNFYFPGRVTHAKGSTPFHPALLPDPNAPCTSMPGWEIYPPVAEMVLTEFSRRYPKIPLYVTENGAAFEDPDPDSAGRVRDPKRLAFIRDHMIHGHRAIQNGVDLRGWYVWSLMDNFEWRFGYKKRFGICHVDYSSFARAIKDSGRWYTEVIAKNGFEAEDLPIVPSPYPA